MQCVPDAVPCCGTSLGFRIGNFRQQILHVLKLEFPKVGHALGLRMAPVQRPAHVTGCVQQYQLTFRQSGMSMLQVIAKAPHDDAANFRKNG